MNMLIGVPFFHNKNGGDLSTNSITIKCFKKFPSNLPIYNRQLRKLFGREGKSKIVLTNSYMN